MCSFPIPGGCFDVITPFCEVHKSSAVPVQEIQVAIAELEEAVSFSPGGQETKKKRQRRKRRLPVKKGGRHFQKSEPHPLTVITSILKKTFFQFMKAGLRKMCILLVFTSCFPGTYGFQTCEKTFPITFEDRIVLRNSKTNLLCTVDKVSSCPQMTNCSGNIEFCTVNNSAIKISYSPAEIDIYYVESKNHESILLDREGCKERDAKNTAEIKPEVNNGWPLHILVPVAVLVAGSLVVVVVVAVVWKRRWCQSSEKSSSKRPSTSLTVDSVAYENSSNNTSLDQLESFIKATGDQPDASSLSVASED